MTCLYSYRVCVYTGNRPTSLKGYVTNKASVGDVGDTRSRWVSVAESDSSDDIVIMQLHYAVEARHVGITASGVRVLFIQEIEVYLQSKLLENNYLSKTIP